MGRVGRWWRCCSITLAMQSATAGSAPSSDSARHVRPAPQNGPLQLWDGAPGSPGPTQMGRKPSPRQPRSRPQIAPKRHAPIVPNSTQNCAQIATQDSPTFAPKLPQTVPDLHPNSAPNGPQITRRWTFAHLHPTLTPNRPQIAPNPQRDRTHLPNQPEMPPEPPPPAPPRPQITSNWPKLPPPPFFFPSTLPQPSLHTFPTPKCLKSDPSSPQICPKLNPTRPQNHPKIHTSRCPQLTQDGPKVPKLSPNLTPRCPKVDPKPILKLTPNPPRNLRLKSPQCRPKTVPKSSQIGPTLTPNCPQSPPASTAYHPQLCPKLPPNRPNHPKVPPSHPQTLHHFHPHFTPNSPNVVPGITPQIAQIIPQNGPK